MSEYGTKACLWCTKDFEPKLRQPDQKYCTPVCRRAANDAARAGGTDVRRIGIEERELERKLLATRASLEATKRDRDRTLRALKEKASELSDTLRELELYQSDLSDRPGWMKAPVPTKGHHGTLVAFLSDTHFGEEVKPDEMAGFNAYDLRIAEGRLKRFFEKTIMISRDFLAGVKYDGIVLALGGDLVSGDIHEELVETNLLSTYETVEWAVPRIAAGIEMFAQEFGNVHVVSAPGNHGRNSKKTRHKRRSANNADTHISRLIGSQLASEKITFDIPASTDVRFDVYGSSFSMEHGDDLRFSGTSEIGSLGPVKRGTLRKSNQARVEGHPFDYFLVGHFHQLVPAAPQGFVMNGSLIGYNEYARAGKFTPEPAQQALMVVTPEHGITVQAPVLVQSRSKEGW